MRANKQITLDIDVIKQLQQEENASELINSLLVQYYDTKGVEIEKKNTGVEEAKIRNQQTDARIPQKTTRETRKRGENFAINEGNEDTRASQKGIERARDSAQDALGVVEDPTLGI